MRSCGNREALDEEAMKWLRAEGVGEHFRQARIPDFSTSEVKFIQSLQDQPPCFCHSLVGRWRLASDHLFSLHLRARLIYA